MSGNGKGRRRHHHQPGLGSAGRDIAVSLAADSPVLAMFKQAAFHLNDRQDRHERLFKMSRDITIESKRIIFLLHSALTKDTSEKAVQEANERLRKLTNGPIKSIALELETIPAYLHSRAVTNGYQEFIEAKTLCSLMENKTIVSHADVQKEFTFVIKDGEAERTVIAMLTQSDYILGIADLTGELMRFAINSIASGDNEECLHACDIVRQLYTGYLGLMGIDKDLGRKMATTRQNVCKIEAAVYALKVRGGEAPAMLLVPPPPPNNDWENQNQSDDEGFY